MIKDGKGGGGLAKSKGGGIASPKINPDVQAQAQQAIDPISGVDSLREQILSKVGARTEALAAEDAQFLANQPAHYLGQLTQKMGTAEVVPVDGFLDYLDRVCSGSIYPEPQVEIGGE